MIDLLSRLGLILVLYCFRKYIISIIKRMDWQLLRYPEVFIPFVVVFFVNSFSSLAFDEKHPHHCGMSI